MKNNTKVGPFLLMIMILISCKKEDEWLDVKSNLNDIRPTTLKDYQAILDADNVINASYPGIGLVASDNVFLTTENYNTLSQNERDAYIWADKVNTQFEWESAYIPIESANIVLDGLTAITRDTGNDRLYDNIKGSALFIRAFSYYSLLPVFCKPYNLATSDADLGLVIRTSSNVNERPQRATLEQTYQQVINDLKDALNLLPSSTAYQTRPNIAAAATLLSKVYLNMADYANALLYSTEAMKTANTLLDFSSIPLMEGALFPFPEFPGNMEVIFWSFQNTYLSVLPGYGVGYVDQDLYKSYMDNDLRKVLFYATAGQDDHYFRGSYFGSDQGILSRNFSGIAANELLLINAECNARLGNLEEARKSLNTLLEKRFVAGTFVPISINDQESLLSLILVERRKELPFTGQIRWEDLRRLNIDGRFSKDISRTIDGVTYTLPAGDPKYVFEIPDKEIQLSGLQQNER